MFTPEINQSAKEAFGKIYQMKGREILKTSKSVQNLISDFLPGYEYEQARNIIRIACEWNIFAYLLDESIPAANRAEYAARQMSEKTCVAVEITREVVSWAAEALGPAQQAEKKTTAPPAQTAPKSTPKPTGKTAAGAAVDYREYLRISTDKDGNRTVTGDREKINGDGLQELVIPDGVTAIGLWAFDGCSCLTSITIPDSVTSIGNWAFQHCSGLMSVTIPDNVTSIGWGVFQHCTGLTSVIIPSGVRSIHPLAFGHCSHLKSITLSPGVTAIEKYAFWDCTGLTSVTLPPSLTAIGKNAFWGCTGLTSVTIPSGVHVMGEAVFAYCSYLTIRMERPRPRFRPLRWHKTWNRDNRPVEWGCKD